MKITLKEVTHQGGSNWFQILVEIRNQASQPIYEAQKWYLDFYFEFTSAHFIYQLGPSFKLIVYGRESGASIGHENTLHLGKYFGHVR